MKRSYGLQVASFFTFLAIIFIPFPFYLSKIQLRVTDFVFGKPIAFISSRLFGAALTSTRVMSDNIAMYVLLLLLLILSIVLTLVVARWPKWNTWRAGMNLFIYRLACYYLALQLVKYGLDKIFKHQFYLPEPNTLYTPLGSLSRGLLYWSAMGTSHLYNVFLGSLELLAAVLILWRRTRLMGLLLGLGIMLNIVAVNFGFDIAVKLFSLFLLFLVAFLLVPYYGPLYRFFILRVAASQQQTQRPTRAFGYLFAKWLAVALICTESLYPFIKSRDFNGDNKDRPFLYGAYEVQYVIAGSDTLEIVASPFKRFFIHSHGYMIFEDQKDAMTDYNLSYDKKDSVLVLTDYHLQKLLIPFSYDAMDSLLTIQVNTGGKTYKLTGRAIDWKEMPALRKGFRWIAPAGN